MEQYDVEVIYKVRHRIVTEPVKNKAEAELIADKLSDDIFKYYAAERCDTLISEFKINAKKV